MKRLDDMVVPIAQYDERTGQYYPAFQFSNGIVERVIEAGYIESAHTLEFAQQLFERHRVTFQTALNDDDQSVDLEQPNATAKRC